MLPWLIGLACVAVGLSGSATARDRTLRGRRVIALLGWLPFAIWTLTLLTRAWRHP